MPEFHSEGIEDEEEEAVAKCRVRTVRTCLIRKVIFVMCRKSGRGKMNLRFFEGFLNNNPHVFV